MKKEKLGAWVACWRSATVNKEAELEPEAMFLCFGLRSFYHTMLPQKESQG